MLSYTSCIRCPSQGETGNRCVRHLLSDQSGAAPATVSERNITTTVHLHGKEMFAGPQHVSPSQARRPAWSFQKQTRGGRALLNPASFVRGVFLRLHARCLTRGKRHVHQHQPYSLRCYQFHPKPTNRSRCRRCRAGSLAGILRRFLAYCSVAQCCP